jgi:hypothetical protein
MDSIQKLRQGARRGQPQDHERAEGDRPETVIVIEPAIPRSSTCPSITRRSYGARPYPVPTRLLLSARLRWGAFVAGVASARPGYAWGNRNWHGGDVDIDVNRNANLNRNINRGNTRGTCRRGDRDRRPGKWQHDASHRKGVGYRDQATAQKFDRGTANDAAKSRTSTGAGRARGDRFCPGRSRRGSRPTDSAVGPAGIEPDRIPPEGRPGSSPRAQGGATAHSAEWTKGRRPTGIANGGDQARPA